MGAIGYKLYVNYTQAILSHTMGQLIIYKLYYKLYNELYRPTSTWLLAGSNSKHRHISTCKASTWSTFSSCHRALRSFYTSIVHLRNWWAAFLPLRSGALLSQFIGPPTIPHKCSSYLWPPFCSFKACTGTSGHSDSSNWQRPTLLARSPCPGPLATHFLS
jgi:hypothetical protein